MRGAAIGVIKASKSDDFPVGSYATGTAGWTELAVMKSKELQRVDVPKNGRITDTLGVLGETLPLQSRFLIKCLLNTVAGMTGLTAYFGLLDVGKVKAGDFVVVSGAAGATGSVVGQIAKLKGARVLGIAGSDDKVQWLKEDLKFDNALNYKDQDFARNFKEATKVFFFFFLVSGDCRVATKEFYRILLTSFSTMVYFSSSQLRIDVSNADRLQSAARYWI